ncbi:hypothetical protein ACLM44_12885 [Synechococcus sp. W2B2]|uniref:hypothetical protein n=1 Tax=unclassified Synechococcus TaxID=2626047 RepID=UPI0039A70147
MTFSPYQHQDPRQISLQRQIEQSRQEGDIRRLQRLELQWVHRYGVASLPGAAQTMIQSEVPQDNPELPPIEVSQDEVDRILGLGQAGAELKEQEPLELKEQEPLELKEQEPLELKEQEPLELKEQEPLELKEQEPLELKEQEPLELKEQEPLELKEQEPLELKEQEPLELKEQEPLELKEQEPLELKEQEHSVPASVVPVPIAGPHRLRRWLKPLPLPESHKAS